MSSTAIECGRCLFSKSNYPRLELDDHGVCHFCRKYDTEKPIRTVPPHKRVEALHNLVAAIKRAGRNKEYDCLIGLSGGIDSAYLALKAADLGLRALALHVDNGWDTELAVSNIQSVVETLHIDLTTVVLDWAQFRSLQIAFLRSGTPDVDIPADHAIQAAMWETARSHGIRYILSGMNFATESISPREWAQGHSDWRYVRAVGQRWGGVDLESFPHFSFPRLAWYGLRRLQIVSLLNYLDFDEPRALAELRDRIDFRPYGPKHGESRYTRFIQGYYLPRRFGIDKRIAHLSALINAGSMTREDALAELQCNDYVEEEADDDLRYVRKKLGLTEADWDDIMHGETKSIHDYPHRQSCFRLLKRLVALARASGWYAR